MRTVAFERSPGGSLPAAIDLFGNGSVTPRSTPAHSRGHLSALVRLEDRDALLLGDAAYTMLNLQDGLLPWRTDDDAYRQSLGELRIFVARNPRALVIPSQDIDVWEGFEP